MNSPRHFSRKMNAAGSVPLADSITCFGGKLPRYLWYMLSGAICDVVQFGLDRLVRKVS